MPNYECRLTVYFEDPFWVCVYERWDESTLEVSKITFGAEPKDNEVYAFLLEHWRYLAFSPPVPGETGQSISRNPKRRRREIKKQLQQTGGGTKSQEAIKLQRSQEKKSRKEAAGIERSLKKARKYVIKQSQKKQKHKGR